MSGFIGRAVVSAFARRGARVLAVSRQAVEFAPPVQSVVLSSYAQLEPPVAGSVLVHLAEPRDIEGAKHIGETYVAARRAALAELLAKEWGHVVYASSAAVYGDSNRGPHRTDEAIEPRGSYAQAKAACERDVLARGGAVARLSNVYGPGMALNNVIADILRQIPRAGPIIVRDRKPVRDYLWIDDAADGLAMLAITRKAGIFNLGTGKGTSVGDLARCALDRAGATGRSVEASETTERESYLVLDISGTTAQLGWAPQVAITQGLAHLLGAA